MIEESSVADQLRTGRSIMINTKGVSMRPLLWQGRTQVLVTPLNRELQLGDITLFYVRDSLSRLHRVIHIDHDYVYTRGDNCLNYEKERIENLLGIVTEIYFMNKKMNMDGFIYRNYVSIWLKSFKFRAIYYKIRFQIGMIGRGIKSYVKKIFW